MYGNSKMRSASPLLPFDYTEPPGTASGDRRATTAFISYSHEKPPHVERVLKLAEKLRADGVDCEIDKYVASPSEGWPLWMQRQIQKLDYVIVVCTEMYARRFAGNETSGKGKGARSEGQLINQILYEEGENTRFIPVVFDRRDVDHIPLVLKNATYYDLGTDDGYQKLHRALTNQPRVQRRPVGAIRRRLPDLYPYELSVTALLYLCPDPLPIDVVARVVDESASKVTRTLQRLIEIAVLRVQDGAVQLEDRSVDGIPEPSGSSVHVALDAALRFVENHRSAGRVQMMNIVTLARVAHVPTSAAQVSRTFPIIQSWLKSSGDKRLVLDIARRSIEASKSPGRGQEQVKDEALAIICGVSWVYQRTGRLLEARTEAERSLALGQDINWDRNTAFCNKCLGRLKRMEAETVIDVQQRITRLKDSASLLRKAIDWFTKEELEAEVGDCYSLLARTHLLAGDRVAARHAIKEADDRLVDPTTKDYLDLQIVKGDLMLHSDRRSAESIYTEVLAESGDDDVQKTEILARAYLHRGKVRAALGGKENALADFRRAAKIWDNLEDPTADFARWEIERAATWVDRETELLLTREPVGVRVRVARIVKNETAARPVGRSHREKLSQNYLRGLISRAKREYAVDRPAW